MFGIKTKLSWRLHTLYSKKITRDNLIRDLMRYFHADEYGHEANTANADLGYGWLHYGLVRQQKPKKILCVGSRHGYIPAILAQGCHDNGFGHVDFVDAGYDSTDPGGWTGVGYWKKPEGKRVFRDFGLAKYITLHLMMTKDFARRYPGRTYDYIYIDGDHSLKGVTIDVELFWPALTKGGYMVFHDICVKGIKPEGEYGVWRMWQKLKKKWGGITIDYSGSGLGIIQKRL